MLCRCVACLHYVSDVIMHLDRSRVSTRCTHALSSSKPVGQGCLYRADIALLLQMISKGEQQMTDPMGVSIGACPRTAGGECFVNTSNRYVRVHCLSDRRTCTTFTRVMFSLMNLVTDACNTSPCTFSEKFGITIENVWSPSACRLTAFLERRCRQLSETL